MTFIPIFDLGCALCEQSPIVGIEDDKGNIRSMGLCGVCYFHDRMMVDYDLWNEQPESTE